MRFNAWYLLVIILILAGVQAGAAAGEPASVDPGTQVPADMQYPVGDMQPSGGYSGWNALYSGLINPGSITGFAATTPQEDPVVDDLLLGNQEFRETVFAADPELYNGLALSQSPQVLWIGCSDSRADPERITSSLPGELFVTRNVGNIVPNTDWNLAAVVEYSVNYLQVKEIVVVGHSDCGAMKALDLDLTDPYIPLWLNDAREAKTRVDALIPEAKTPEELKVRARLIEEENVRLQIEHLMTYPTVKQAVDEGRIQVHGLYYDLATGTLSRVT
jgi:carbonic anhydrase